MSELRPYKVEPMYRVVDERSGEVIDAFERRVGADDLASRLNAQCEEERRECVPNRGTITGRRDCWCCWANDGTIHKADVVVSTMKHGDRPVCNAAAKRLAKNNELVPGSPASTIRMGA